MCIWPTIGVRRACISESNCSEKGWNKNPGRIRVFVISSLPVAIEHFSRRACVVASGVADVDVAITHPTGGADRILELAKAVASVALLDADASAIAILRTRNPGLALDNYARVSRALERRGAGSYGVAIVVVYTCPPSVDRRSPTTLVLGSAVTAGRARSSRVH